MVAGSRPVHVTRLPTVWMEKDGTRALVNECDAASLMQEGWKTSGGGASGGSSGSPGGSTGKSKSAEGGGKPAA